MFEWLKQRRNEIHISQDELASRLQLKGHNISRATISHWEMGRTPIPFKDGDFAQGLADSLEMTVADMLSQAGYLHSSEFSEIAYRAAAMIEAMTPSRQKTALVLLEQLLKET